MNTTSVKLNDTTFKEIEGIIQKVAQDNKIANVTSVSIKLSKDQSLVSFDKVAVPTDLAEELGPQSVSPESKLHDIVADLGSFIDSHKESGMIPDSIKGRLDSAFIELRAVWADWSDETRGEGWASR